MKNHAILKIIKNILDFFFTNLQSRVLFFFTNLQFRQFALTTGSLKGNDNVI